MTRHWVDQAALRVLYRERAKAEARLATARQREAGGGSWETRDQAERDVAYFNRAVAAVEDME